MPVIAKRFRSFIGNHSFRTLLLRRKQRQALQPPPSDLTTSLLREGGSMVLANLPDPPEHPSSLLLRHQQRQALQPAPFEPNISLLREEGSILITNLPDPPEHPSSLSLPLPPDDTNKLQWLPPIPQQAAAYKEIPNNFNSSTSDNPNTIGAGHRFTELPDPPEQPSSLSPPCRPEQDVVVKDILHATIDKKHHSAIGDEPGRYLPASSKSACH